MANELISIVENAFKIQYGEIYSFVTSSSSFFFGYLKSSMERFIAIFLLHCLGCIAILKSSMERFIET